LGISLENPLPIFVALAILLLFFYLVSIHRSIENKKLFFRTLIELNEEEIKRYYGELPENQRGRKFRSIKSLFAEDLDLFGEHSLFQHLSRCFLRESKLKLAKFLTEPELEKSTVEKRQNIIRSLTHKIDWSQKYLSIIRFSHLKSKEEIETDSIFKDFDNHTGNSLGLLIIGLLTISSGVLLLYFLGFIPFFSLLIIGVINYGIMVRYQSKVLHLSIKTDHLVKYIQLHLRAMRFIYEENFNSNELKELASPINKTALLEIQKLENTLRWLDSRGNMFYGIINAFLVLDLILFFRLIKWINKNKSALPKWMDTVYDFEMYCSLSSFYFQNPEFNFPTVSDEGTHLYSKEIGHPLIRKESRVYNDFSFGREKLYLVTGSNMSGKSTFLRTVGINVLMAWCGLPVCAQEMNLSRFIIFCSMRTQDNLAENTSSFYAELRRIKLLLSLLDNNELPVIYFLDEILKGTNSADRHSGAMGIIKKLLVANANGFISTHDLSLADEYETNKKVKNISFNSELVNGELLFDYKIKNSKCLSTNASQLMKNMGIID
jgi:DNA mismatch repair ATPase MutS